MPLYRLKVARTVEQHGEVVVEAPSADAAVDLWMRRIRKAPSREQYGLNWSDPTSPSHRVTHFKGAGATMFVEVPEQWNIDSYRHKPKE